MLLGKITTMRLIFYILDGYCGISFPDMVRDW